MMGITKKGIIGFFSVKIVNLELILIFLDFLIKIDIFPKKNLNFLNFFELKKNLFMSHTEKNIRNKYEKKFKAYSLKTKIFFLGICLQCISLEFLIFF